MNPLNKPKEYSIDSQGPNVEPSLKARLSEAMARFTLNPSTVHYSELRRLMYAYQQREQGADWTSIEHENELLDEYEMQALTAMME